MLTPGVVKQRSTTILAEKWLSGPPSSSRMRWGLSGRPHLPFCKHMGHRPRQQGPIFFRKTTQGDTALAPGRPHSADGA